MNQKYFFQFLSIFLTIASTCLDASSTSTLGQYPMSKGVDPQQGVVYDDQFGSTKSIYSMGDFVRYTVTPGQIVPVAPVNPAYANQAVGLNLYYNIVDIPGALDIYNFTANAPHLYNFLGYLYAGYAAVSINPTQSVLGAPGTEFQNSPWLTTFRTVNLKANAQTSLNFDNNNLNQELVATATTVQDWANAMYTIQLVDFSKTLPFAYLNPASVCIATASYPTPFTMVQPVLGNNPQAIDQGSYFVNPRFVPNDNVLSKMFTTPELVTVSDIKIGFCEGSCSWNTNSGAQSFVLAIPFSWFEGYSADQCPTSSDPAGCASRWGSNICNELSGNCRQVPQWTFASQYGYGGGFAAPYGQFFGARIAHILGALVNDVPNNYTAASLSTSTWPSMATGTPMPQIALVPGGTATTIPAGGSTPSTAHFGSIMNFLNYWSEYKVNQTIQDSEHYLYLMNHLLPAVQRFATGGAASAPLCSYGFAATPASANLIEIVDGAIKPYDNGVIVDIENNTGHDLVIKQSMKGGGENKIGVIKSSDHHYFLHTASLMQSLDSTVPAVAGQPPLGNLIEIKDLDNEASAYIQLFDATQLTSAVTNLNGALNNIAGGSGQAFVYNQNIKPYAGPEQEPAYLVVSNFDSNNLATMDSSKVLLGRLQAVNIGHFKGMPYFVTLQINKEPIGYGLKSGTIVGRAKKSKTPGAKKSKKPGVPHPEILYPSILSVKPYSWLNPYGQSQGPSFFSKIPLLLLPQSVQDAKVTGLQAHYNIWLMAYAAALTEFQLNCRFGDTLDCVHKTFQLFDVRDQQVPARAVIDANGVLKSGHILKLGKVIGSALQADAEYSALIGSDVWDIGSNFNQDIPILHLYTDASGNLTCNKSGQDYLNFAVTFEREKSVGYALQQAKVGMPATVAAEQAADEKIDGTSEIKTFKDGYGRPYTNVAMVSLPTAKCKQGVEVECSNLGAGHWQLIFKDSQATDNVLAFAKLFLGADFEISRIKVQFLNSTEHAWSSRLSFPSQQIGVTPHFNFTMRYNIVDGMHALTHMSGLMRHTQKIKKVKNTHKTSKKSLKAQKPVKAKKKAKDNS
jgi:hypothetical protein